MTLIIPDEVLKQTGLTERELLVELGCRLYEAGKLTKTQASRLVGMDRDEFNAELTKRGLPVIRYTDDDFDREVQTLTKLEREGFWGPGR